MTSRHHAATPAPAAPAAPAPAAAPAELETGTSAAAAPAPPEPPAPAPEPAAAPAPTPPASQAPANEAAPVAAAGAPGTVMVRVLPMGHGKVATGATNSSPNEDEGEERFPTHKRGDRFVVASKIAVALEARGFVEIEG